MERYFIYIWNEGMISEKHIDSNVNEMFYIIKNNKGFSKENFEIINAAFVAFEYPDKKIFNLSKFTEISLHNFIVQKEYTLTDMISLILKSIVNNTYDLDEKGILFFNSSKKECININDFYRFLSCFLNSVNGSDKECEKSVKKNKASILVFSAINIFDDILIKNNCNISPA